MALGAESIFLLTCTVSVCVILIATWSTFSVRSYLLKKAAIERYRGGYAFPFPQFHFQIRNRRQCVINAGNLPRESCTAQVHAARGAHGNGARVLSRRRGSLTIAALAASMGPLPPGPRRPRVIQSAPSHGHAHAPATPAGDGHAGEQLLSRGLVVPSADRNELGGAQGVPPPPGQGAHQSVGVDYVQDVRRSARLCAARRIRILMAPSPARSPKAHACDPARILPGAST